jgi:alkylated DNA repair protein alkB family protein 1
MTTDKKEPDETSWSAFKRAHVRYRRKSDDSHHLSDLADLIDFSAPSKTRDARIVDIYLPDNATDLDVYRGPLYGLEGFSGFVYAPQALNDSLQTELAYHAVSKWCEEPHTTNIQLNKPKESEIDNGHDNMWKLWKQENEYGYGDEQQPRPKPLKHAKKEYKSFQKLSWATCGYHYDWSARTYHEGAKSIMPRLLADVSTLFARTAMLVTNPSPSFSPSDDDSSSSLSFTPSACIVNYYNLKAQMGGHRDDLEEALDKPIVSLSVGLPAVFLLGGKTKEESPVLPILIRPGDVMCMGGDTRLNYHAMARLLPSVVSLPEISEDIITRSRECKVSLVTLLAAPSTATTHTKTATPSQQDNPLPQCKPLARSDIPERDSQALSKYLSSHRINVNVRQVYPD